MGARMKMIISMKGPFFAAKFIEGPRKDFFASKNIGTPEERALIFPDRESILTWMAWNGHEEYVPPVFDALAYLELKTTRELLGIRDHCYWLGGEYDVTENGGRCVVTLELVKAVLATREHIPGKIEAKAIRQRKAHAQRNR